MARPSRGSEKRTAVWASPHEERGSDGAVAPPMCAHRVVLHRCVCGSGATPRGQQWPPACTLPHGRDGLRVRLKATCGPCGRSSMRRPAHRPFLRNALPEVTTISPVASYYRISYVRDTVGVRRSSFFTAGCCAYPGARSLAVGRRDRVGPARLAGAGRRASHGPRAMPGAGDECLRPAAWRAAALALTRGSGSATVGVPPACARRTHTGRELWRCAG